MTTLLDVTSSRPALYSTCLCLVFYGMCFPSRHYSMDRQVLPLLFCSNCYVRKDSNFLFQFRNQRRCYASLQSTGAAGVRKVKPKSPPVRWWNTATVGYSGTWVGGLVTYIRMLPPTAAAGFVVTVINSPFPRCQHTIVSYSRTRRYKRWEGCPCTTDR